MHKFAKKIMECVKTKVDGIGIDNIEGQHLEELKMWACVAKDIAEYDYYYHITEAMDDPENEYGVDYDENGPKYYGGRRRSAITGRFIRGYEEKIMNPDRDMDRMNEGRMYYTDSSNTHVVNPVTRPYTDMVTPSITNMKDNGRFSNSRRMYMETKETKPGDKSAHQDKLSVTMDDLSTDIKEMWPKMGNEEKTIAKTKLQNLVNTL